MLNRTVASYTMVKIHSMNASLILLIMLSVSACHETQPQQKVPPASQQADSVKKPAARKDSVVLDTLVYNQRLRRLVTDSHSVQWPAKGAYPLPGAILPFKRVIAYYGNFYSAGMGILGELSIPALITKLREETAKWEKADSLTPVIAAIHYIAVTAQGSNGSTNKYRLRMPAAQIEKAIALADSINGIVFLDIQVGHSTLEEEIPLLEKYLAMPTVHLGIDPEYSMKNGNVPSTSIGTFDAADVNYASGYLAGIVNKYHLPPKILVVHRFTEGMVTNSKSIVTRPEVQIVMNMDGFGPPAKKINSYQRWIERQPVQFTGFKLFYRQDANMMSPQQVLKLNPKPVYIQYQ
jgi:hypothetical protein